MSFIPRSSLQPWCRRARVPKYIIPLSVVLHCLLQKVRDLFYWQVRMTKLFYHEAPLTLCWSWMRPGNIFQLRRSLMLTFLTRTFSSSPQSTFKSSKCFSIDLSDPHLPVRGDFFQQFSANASPSWEVFVLQELSRCFSGTRHKLVMKDERQRRMRISVAGSKSIESTLFIPPSPRKNKKITVLRSTILEKALW